MTSIQKMQDEWNGLDPAKAMDYLNKRKDIPSYQKIWNKLNNREKLNYYENKVHVPYYDLVEDSYYYDNGLCIIVYTDEERENEDYHIDFDLNNIFEFLDFPDLYE